MILAIDPGTNNNFAVCSLCPDGIDRVHSISVKRLKAPKATYSIGKRLLHFYNQLKGYTSVSLVLVEGAAYSKSSRVGFDSLAQIRGLVHLAAADIWQCPCIEVPPSTLTKHATGKGRWPNSKVSKQKMVLAAQQQGYAGANDNEADAWLLACYAMFSPTMPDGTSPGPLHLQVKNKLL